MVRSSDGEVFLILSLSLHGLVLASDRVLPLRIQMDFLLLNTMLLTDPLENIVDTGFYICGVFSGREHLTDSCVVIEICNLCCRRRLCE